MVTFLRAHLVDHAGIFGDLRRLMAFLSRLEQGAGIGHRVIKPELVEFVAQIIVIADVLARLFTVIALQPKAEFLELPHKPHAGKAVIKAVIIRMDPIHERLQIGRCPPLVQIGIAKTQIALADQPGKKIRVVDMHFGNGARIGPFGPKPPPIVQNKIDTAGVHALRHVKDTGEIARQIGLAVGGCQDHAVSPFRILCKVNFTHSLAQLHRWSWAQNSRFS
mmetsp:Transcript_28845/g.54896  ORF Transcript_28845/g.54896 Transcript_28845/m.54896 type:complete len:221 (+) Transcript_28845:866-1528(+)